MKKILTLFGMLLLFVISSYATTGSDESNYTVVTETTELMSISTYCDNVTVSGREGRIRVNGITTSSNRVRYRLAGTSTYTPACRDNCVNPQIIPDLAAGTYEVEIRQSGPNGKNQCTITRSATVTPQVDLCAGASVVGRVGNIRVNGVTAATNRVRYRLAGTSTYAPACRDNCTNPQIIPDLAAGTYEVEIRQAGPNGGNQCTVVMTAEVAAPIDFCATVSATGGVETISVSGITAPWSSIQYRLANGSAYSIICNENCGNQQTVTGVPAGSYVIRVEQSEVNGRNACAVEIPVTVAAPRIDFCAGVTVTGGVEEFTVSGVTAPWRSIQFRYANGSTYTPLCTENCGNPQLITGVAAGSYIVKIEQSEGGNRNFCVVEIPVTVTAPRIDFCAGVSAAGGVETISVSGITAPWSRVQYRLANSSAYSIICNETCGNPQTVTVSLLALMSLR